MTEFKSQICTTVEQSKRLLGLGLKKETADMNYTRLSRNDSWTLFIGKPLGYEDIPTEYLLPAWSLHRLILLLDTIACDWIFRNGDCYTNVINGIEWLIKEGYFNKEYLVDLTGTDSHQDMVDAFGYAFEAMKAKKEE